VRTAKLAGGLRRTTYAIARGHPVRRVGLSSLVLLDDEIADSGIDVGRSQAASAAGRWDAPEQ
jgi:hypothetical protein